MGEATVLAHRHPLQVRQLAAAAVLAAAAPQACASRAVATEVREPEQPSHTARERELAPQSARG